METKHQVVGIRKNGKLKLFLDGKELDPSKSQKAWNHSPDGFNAGYGGSGPAQSALAILLEVTDEEKAVRSHQEFKSLFLMKREYQDAQQFEFEFVWRE